MTLEGTWKSNSCNDIGGDISLYKKNDVNIKTTTD